MKKITCTLFLFFLLPGLQFAQTTISPNVGFRSQTLTTTITNPNFFLSFGSAPQSSSDIWLYRLGNYIYSSSYSIINNTTLHATFTIPPNFPTGLYDVNLAMWSWVFDVLPGGFNVIGSGIAGHVYNDLNSNGIQDAGELNLPHKRILLQPGNLTAFTDLSGNYSFALPAGNYTVQFVPDTTWTLTSSPSLYNVNTTTGSVFNINFGVHANSTWYGISTYLGSEQQPRCNTQRDYTIVIHNYGTGAQNGTVEFTRSSICSFIYSIPVPSTVVGNVYTWNYSNLPAGGYLSFTVRLGIPFAPSTVITNSAFTTAMDLSNNVVDTSGFILSQTILCSFDPNDKVVEPSGDATPQHYSPIYDEYFYTIHFQNTGNDTAFSINIYDTLDVSLDLNTFVFAGSSDYCETYLEPNRVVRFYFPNINLPDSIVDEVNSHGFVAYRIYPTFGLPDFTVVNNRASIVFDQNPPILTNNVFNTLISFPTGKAEGALQGGEVTVFPNPVTNESVISINQKGSHNYELRIYDSTGRLVKTTGFSSNGYLLKKKDFAAGMYLYRIREVNGTFSKSGKLIIE